MVTEPLETSINRGRTDTTANQALCRAPPSRVERKPIHCDRKRGRKHCREHTACGDRSPSRQGARTSTAKDNYERDCNERKQEPIKNALVDKRGKHSSEHSEEAE